MCGNICEFEQASEDSLLLLNLQLIEAPQHLRELVRQFGEHESSWGVSSASAQSKGTERGATMAAAHLLMCTKCYEIAAEQNTRWQQCSCGSSSFEQLPLA